MSITLPRQYPSLDICMCHICFIFAVLSYIPCNTDPTVYPNFEIYPGHLILAQYPLEPVSTQLRPRYPAFNICSYYSHLKTLMRNY